MNYYMLIAKGRRTDNHQIDYVICKEGEECGLYSEKKIDNRIYTFKLELEELCVYFANDEFEIKIHKFSLVD